MDQQKIGKLLKELRKERGLTQEQLAGQLNVSNRSVSRWETGANLPDVDVLVILSEFYDVSVGELLAGERRTEPQDEKEVVIQAAQYSRLKETHLMQRLFLVITLAIAALGISFFVYLCLMDDVTGGGIVPVLTLLCFAIYNISMFANKRSRSTKGYFAVVASGLAAVIVSNVLLAVLFFGSGSYHNYGMAGIYYAFGILVGIFTVAGIVTRIVLKRANKD